jgi:pyruvate kinase
MMAAIATETEHANLPENRSGTDFSLSPSSEAEAVAQGACHIATTMAMEAIIAVTLEGTTARLLAKYRPAQPIFAITSRGETYRRLALVRGVTPFLLPADITTREAMIEKAKEVMCNYGLRGKKVVIISSISAEQNLLVTDVL